MVAWVLQLGWGCCLLPLLFRAEQPDFGWQALHNATGSWENDTSPDCLHLQVSVPQRHSFLCLTPLPTTGVDLLSHPPARTW